MLEDVSETVRNLLPYFCIIFLLCSPALADKNFDIKRLVIIFLTRKTFVMSYRNIYPYQDAI